VGIDFSFIAKSTPAILVLGGVLFMFMDNTVKTSFGLAGWALIGVGVLLSLAWMGVFRR